MIGYDLFMDPWNRSLRFTMSSDEFGESFTMIYYEFRQVLASLIPLLDSRRLFIPARDAVAVHSTPYTLHPTSFTLHPTPYTLHPTPWALNPTPYTLHPTPCTLHPTPYTLNPEPTTLNPKPHTRSRVQASASLLPALPPECALLTPKP